MTTNHSQHSKLYDIILSGGPPWGFTLSGGSEFGSKLYVNKVSNESNPIQGRLCEGDEILSVNGVSCTSQTNAIQMVRTVEDELRLKICRWNPDTKQPSGEKQSDNKMVDTMNDLSHNIYSIKGGGMQAKNFNNNDRPHKQAQQHKTFYKSQPMKIVVGEKNQQEPRNVVLENKNERCVDMEPVRNTSKSNITTTNTPQPQKVTVKLVPAASSNTTHYPSKTKHQLSSSNSGSQQQPHVENESVQKVSKARAMFESMSSSNIAASPKLPRAPKLKSWNSGGSLLDEKGGEKRWQPQPRSNQKHETNRTENHRQRHHHQQQQQQQQQKHVHKHSRSLPIEMAGNEFDKAKAAYQQTVMATTVPITNVDRPKSAYYYEQHPGGETHRHNASPSRQRNENSDPLEDLHHVRDYPKRLSMGSGGGYKNDSANELREATDRYHQELMKNYPTFRSSISSKDLHGHNLSRKASASEDAFSRGEPFRATIATATPSRGPTSRSNSLDDPTRLINAFAHSNENSMMSRLLQGQTQASLKKIDEEAARNARMESSGSSSPPLLRSNSLRGHNQPMRRSYTEPEQHLSSFIEGRNKQAPRRSPEMKSICIQTDPGSEDEANVNQIRGTTDVQTSTETLVRRYSNDITKSNQNKKLRDASTTSTEIQVTDIGECYTSPPEANRPYLDDFEPTQFADVATNELVSNELQTNTDYKRQQNSASTISSETSTRSIATTSENNNTDIIVKSLDELEIVHSKNPSTDSAVYISPDQQHYSSQQGEGLTSINISAFEQHHLQQQKPQELEFPAQPEVSMQDLHEAVVEREKPQRTINRKKKDSGLVTSRNNSCVSTDSTTSTGTVDSGIVVRSEPSPRTSPISSDQYYRDISASRETLDGDVNELEKSQPSTSTPDRHFDGNNVHDDDSYRQENSMREISGIESPIMDDLDSEKMKLIESMREKIRELREQEQEIADEIKSNEELGKKVLNMVNTKATQSEFSKYDLFIGELNKIVALLLSLTQRLHRYEMMLQDLDMSNESDKQKKEGLITKIQKLKSQHEEACYLREVNDKRGDNVAAFLDKYCTEEEFADFQYYVDMKSQLALMQSEIREKVKLGEERLKALEETGTDWGLG